VRLGLDDAALFWSTRRRDREADVSFKVVIAAAAASGLSMCATEPAPEPAPVEEADYQTGPDGLPIRHSPTDAVVSGALPDAAPAPVPAEEG
jgi:hypothetical protein